ncbi:MAG: hypothetical protein QXU45_07055 [Candidatus Bathyarchaeia archaeon]
MFNVGPNPYTVPDYVTRPDGFYIYFDVDCDGKLSTPEDAKGLLNFIGIYHGKTFWSQSISKDGFWPPTAYQASKWKEARPEMEVECLWDDDVNAGVYYKKPYDISTHGSGGYYNGDQHFEFCFPLNSNDTFADGLHLKTGETKIMGFALEFYRQGYYLENGTYIPDLYDYWPGEGFTPNVIANASEYAKMSIDLSTPNNRLSSQLLLAILAITLLTATTALSIKFIKAKRRTSVGGSYEKEKCSLGIDPFVLHFDFCHKQSRSSFTTFHRIRGFCRLCKG